MSGCDADFHQMYLWEKLPDNNVEDPKDEDHNDESENDEDDSDVVDYTQINGCVAGENIEML